MLGLSLMVIGVLMFLLMRASGGTFASQFASLLERAVMPKTKIWAYIRGVDHVGGEYGGRPVVLVLHHKRTEHQMGYLVLAMKTHATAAAVSGTGFRHANAGTGERDALDDLELRNELKLDFEDGWLRATWMPVSFAFFPGRFDEARWRNVLRCMETLVSAIERAGAPTVSPPSR